MTFKIMPLVISFLGGQEGPPTHACRSPQCVKHIMQKQSFKHDFLSIVMNQEFDSLLKYSESFYLSLRTDFGLNSVTEIIRREMMLKGKRNCKSPDWKQM